VVAGSGFRSDTWSGATLDCLSRLTIVIPTIGRPEFLRRQVEYWKDSPVKVVILDGSNIKASDLDLPPNFTHLRSLDGFCARLLSAIGAVETEFVALLADDEFFLKSGLVNAINRMDSDDEVIGCVGRCLYFFVDQGRFLASHAYRDWKPFPSTARFPVNRLDLDLPPNKTHMAMYGVYRREKWVSMIRAAYSVQFSCGYVYERLLNLQRSILGRTEIIESLLWMRSKENPSIVNTEVRRTGGHDFVTWATSPEFNHEVYRYKGIALDLLRDSGFNDADAAGYLDRFFNGGVFRQKSKEQLANKSLKRKLGLILLRYSPRSLRLFCKRHVPARYLRFTGWEGHDLSKVISSLRDQGTHFNEPELWDIARLSLSLHERRGHGQLD